MGRLNAERQADPALGRALRRLASWQAARLGETYADLAAQPRYSEAIAFFKTDLYGVGDFARRDADLARAAPSMMRILPASVIGSVATAMELHALSEELDRLLLAKLPRTDAPLTVVEYCEAYRAMDHRSERERQIELIGEFGHALDGYLRTPLIKTALRLMRHPARVAGLGTLQAFLERGCSAFLRMHGAAEFLATIDRRERALMTSIFAGDTAPFAEPVVRADNSAPTGPGRG